jgi:hypothetical protein
MQIETSNFWINTNLVLNYLELKIILVLIFELTLLKQHNLSVERYINHFKVANQH